MPTPPEFRDGCGKIRIAEVFREAEPEHPSDADGHIRITAEIEINLHCISDYSDPGEEYRPFRHPLYGGVKKPQIIGEKNFFPQTDNEAADAFSHIFGGDLSFLQIGFDIGVFHDGAGYKLREHGDIHGEKNEVFLHFDFSPIDVDNIGKSLKGVERDPDGQRQFAVRKING